MRGRDSCNITSQPGSIVPSSSNRPKLVLTEQNAINIFHLNNKHSFPTAHAASCFLASKYHVSSKAIRDIWSGRSWLETTYDHWKHGEQPQRRFFGRPKEEKDQKPRKFSQQSPLHRGSAISNGINAQHDVNAFLEAAIALIPSQKSSISPLMESMTQVFSLPSNLQPHAGWYHNSSLQALQCNQPQPALSVHHDPNISNPVLPLHLLHSSLRNIPISLLHPPPRATPPHIPTRTPARVSCRPSDLPRRSRRCRRHSTRPLLPFRFRRATYPASHNTRRSGHPPFCPLHSQLEPPCLSPPIPTLPGSGRRLASAGTGMFPRPPAADHASCRRMGSRPRGGAAAGAIRRRGRWAV
jgi:hypothetical protein